MGGLAAAEQAAVASGEAMERPVADRVDLGRLGGQGLLDAPGLAGWVAVGPRGFDEEPARQGIAGLVDRPRGFGAPARGLAGPGPGEAIRSPRGPKRGGTEGSP